MAYFADLLTGLRAGIATAWPEVKAAGIYEARQLATIPWEDKAGSLPLAVIDLDLGESEWPAAVEGDAGTATIYYVCGTSVTADALWAKLEALRAQIGPDGTDLTAGQVLGTRLTCSLNLPVNQYFLNTGKPFYAGALVARLIIHEA